MQLTTLPPGNYQLDLAARGSNGVWNREGLSLPIIVYPPWYQTTMAYTAYGVTLVLTLALTALGLRRRFQASIRREQELEIRIAARTNELEIAKRDAEEASRAKSEFLAVMSQKSAHRFTHYRMNVYCLRGHVSQAIETCKSRGHQRQDAASAHQRDSRYLEDRSRPP